jgi:predicted DNA-binding WGR domain protein
MLDASRPSVRLILPAQVLIKDLSGAQKFANQAGYFLWNGRWHKHGQDKPAPKGAPMAAHPHAAGQHAPAKHFTDEQWAQLKLPPENVNAGHYNKQLDHLKQMSEAGHVTGILGHSFGTNTYGKKLAKVANHLLGLHGSQHQVTPGQKAGEHAAVKQAPEEPAKQDPVQNAVQPEHKPLDHGELNVPGKTNNIDAQLDKYKAQQQAQKQADAKAASQQKKSDKAQAKELFAQLGQAMVEKMTPGIAQKQGLSEKKAAKEIHSTLDSMVKWEPAKFLKFAEQFKKEQGEAAAAPEAAPAAAQEPSAPDAEPAKPAPKVVARVPKAAEAEQPTQSQSGETGPKDGDTKQGADGTLTFKDGRWHKQDEAAAPEQPTDLDEMAQAVQDAADTMQHHDALQAATAYVVKHKGADWAWNDAKDALQAAGLSDLAQALDHIKQKPGTIGSKQADPPGAEAVSEPLPEKSGGASSLAMPDFTGGTVGQSVITYYQDLAKKLIALAEAGDVGELEHVKAQGMQPNSKGKVSNTWAGKTPNSKLLLGLHAEALEKAKGGAKAGKPETKPEPEPEAAAPAAPEPVPAAVTPEPAKPEPTPDTGPLTADQLGKLQSIPWHKLKLPDTNTNAASVNKKLQALQDAAFAGDVAAIQAMKWGANTYNKKLELAAKTALAALGEATAAAPAEPAAAAPASAPAAPAPAPAAAQPASPPPAVPKTVTAPKTTLHNTQPGHSKSWSVYVAPNASGGFDMVTEYGKIGGTQQKTVKPFPTSAEAHAAASKLTSEKKAKGYAQVNKDYGHQVAISGGPEAGPKEGDTKVENGVTYQLINGRWHKVSPDDQGQQQSAAPEPEHPVDAVATPDFESLGGGANDQTWNFHYKNIAAKLKELVKNGGASALSGVVINHKNGTFTVNAAGVKVSHVGPSDIQTPKAKRRAMLHQFITDLKAAAGKPSKNKPAPKATIAPAAAPVGPAIEAMDGWLQVGGQGGSNPGGKFKDPSGQEWYCKFPGDDDTAKSEVLAAKLYGLAGLQSQQAKLITKGGKIGIASKWVDVKKASTPAALAAVADAQSGFAVDAWLANWDVVGLGYDNLQVGPDGKAVRVDAGGSLEYRAQGAKKPFGPKVDEIDTLRDAKKNPQAAAVFGKMTTADITASVAKVLAISDAQIRAIVAEHGPGDAAAKKALADTLIARKQDLAAKYPKAAKQTAKKALDPAALPVKPEDLPKRHDFANWKGQGQGLSSKPHVNAANQAVEDQMYALAKTGNLTELKKFHYQPLDKETGAPTGNPIPIEKHPSKHVVQLHSDLVTALDEIANPPQPLKIFRETEVSTLDGLSAAFPSKKFGTTVNKVASNEKLGFWVAMGAVKGAAAKFAPSKVSDFTQSSTKAAYDNFKKMKPLAKHFIHSVQASGSYNDLFRNGKETDHQGNKLADVAQAALDAAVSQPEGTSLYRWQNMSDEMVKHIMAAQEGTVFQATGPMCTSYHPTATSGFGAHRIIIRYAKGAKAVESFGSGGFAGEKEVTTLPNSRFVILKKEMVPGKSGTGKRLELEVLMLPPDLGL